MSFRLYTTCPICGMHTPMLKREQRGKVIRETTWCTQHGFIFWNCCGDVRKFAGSSGKLPDRKLEAPGSFTDRCDQWLNLKFQGSNGIRRIPPKRR